MRIGKSWLIFFVIGILVIGGLIFIFVQKPKENQSPYISSSAATTSTISVASTTTSPMLPLQVLLNDNYYVPQTFNNCGPAALSMDLSFYGVNVTQEALADILRPDHNTTGHNDEKSTPPEDIAAQAESYGPIAYYRPAGNIDLLKQLVAAGFPVLVRTLFMPTDEVAHYRVITGYNDATATPVIIDEDGFQGPNVMYSDADFMSLWKYYNYEYIVLASPSQVPVLDGILGNDVDAPTAWQDAKNIAANDIAQNSSDYLATFNLSVADYYLGDYASSTQAFESVETLIPPNTLWYQIEPIESYYELGQYDKVYSLSETVFEQGNIAVPELHVLRGESDEKEGNLADAKNEFETALFYNKNLQSAQDALDALVASSTNAQ
ncbi:MAG TPA: C39 family peptidase [Candidatus Paceibacterota bacterium]|nr:C39 family peptidase [Candidatus Paceibacterota bacterium]